MTLRFAVEFSDTHPSGIASERTRGRLRATLSGRAVWDLDWTWVEVLEHLARHWRFLVHEESAPAPFNAFAPDTLHATARRYFEENPSDEDEAAFEAFVESHDLSRALKGAWPRKLWLMRCGRRMFVWSPAVEALLPFDGVVAELESLAATIVARLDGATDDRSVLAVQAWATRDALPDLERLVIETGLPEAALAKTAGAEDPIAFWLSPSGQSGELVAVARMTGHVVDVTTLRRVLSTIRMEARRETAELDALADRVGALLAPASGEPTAEGNQAALELRRALRVGSRFDVADALSQWGVPVRQVELPASIDAVCVWGPSHGPVILVNPSGLHARTDRGLRATLAHELCHLLLDRKGALPVAEVLGAGLPVKIERRARAFAAEVLLPKDIARSITEQQLERGADIEDVVRHLVGTYDVSQEIVAWQLRNSAADVTAAERHYLRGLVSDPVRF